MADEKKPNRKRNGSVEVGPSTEIRKLGKMADKHGNEWEAVSAGRYTTYDGKNVRDDVAYRNKLRSLRGLADSFLGSDETFQSGKMAGGLFGDGGVGYADIADSNNIGYYSYEFPVDALELPASRAEELRFYRLAYDRDPIVGRAIDMHTELPVSKMTAEKPKCSSEEYADYVYDDFQRFMNRTRLFQVIIDAAREYWCIGETFLFIEDPEDIEPCKAAKDVLEKEGKGGGDSTEPGTESAFHPPTGGTADGILEYLQPEKRSSWVAKRASVIDELKTAGIRVNFEVEDMASEVDGVTSKIAEVRGELNKKTRKFAKTAGIAPKKLAKMILVAEDIQKLTKLIRGEHAE